MVEHLSFGRVDHEGSSRRESPWRRQQQGPCQLKVVGNAEVIQEPVGASRGGPETGLEEIDGSFPLSRLLDNVGISLKP